MHERTNAHEEEYMSETSLPKMVYLENLETLTLSFYENC